MEAIVKNILGYIENPESAKTCGFKDFSYPGAIECLDFYYNM